jgi:hypothetical protein
MILDRNSPKFYQGISHLADFKIAIIGSIIGLQISVDRRFQRLLNESFLELNRNFKSIPVQAMDFQQNQFFW